jgi:hypothetical protein
MLRAGYGHRYVKGRKMEVDEILSVLGQYPMCTLCFSEYVRWLGENCTGDMDDNDLIYVLKKVDAARLEGLERLLRRACEILGMNETEFKNAFGFSTDLLTQDPDKVHDILAEPEIVVSLSDHGFRKIRKLPRFIKLAGERIPAADFVAEGGGKNFAIELKTIRMENKPRPQPGEVIGNSMVPSWWRNMFRNNIITKIEDKDKRVLRQLSNTKKHQNCDYTMLALYNRRLGPSTLMETQGYEEELTAIMNLYVEIDYIFFKDYFGDVVVCPPI